MPRFSFSSRLLCKGANRNCHAKNLTHELMASHSEKKTLPYSPDQMYALVADIESYPKFLPWCAAARIRSRRMDDPFEIIEADLVVSFKVFRERFGSRVTLNEDARHIRTEYIDGPFRYLESDWNFTEAEGGCEVDFSVDFEFKNVVLQTAIGLVFNDAMQRIVRAFERRAQELHG